MWSSAALRAASTTQQSREVSKAQLHEPQGGRVGERETGKQGNRGREIKREREGDRHRQSKTQVRPKKTHQIFNVVFQQSPANFQRFIPPAPLKCEQNVPQILQNGTQNALKVILLRALGTLLGPSGAQVTKACKKGCLKAAKGCQKETPKSRKMHKKR